MKRFIALSLAIVLFAINSITVNACDENQVNNYVTEIIFGDEATSYSSNDDVKMLLNALYLCCEQANNQGQEKIDYLKLRKVSKIPTISDINVSESALNDCAHICWENEYPTNKKARLSRKRILQNTVNKVFDFGTFNNLFGSETGQCNSFAALLYYSHILSDYLADDPEATEINIKGKAIDAYCGQAYTEINGGRPQFTASLKQLKESYASYSSLDEYGRCGVAFALLGTDIMPPAGSRQEIGMIKPSGWSQEKYPGLVNSEPPFLFNRCHLIAHQLAGNDGKDNLITGTRYLNVIGMKPFEDKVAEYISNTGNHVLYRATPVFDGDNKVASGVQLEAYSVEDAGKGISFNIYCYNVQPGVKINYASGKNESLDKIKDSSSAIPFVVSNPSDSNPDLIYEVNKHLAILFEYQKNSSNYNAMIGEINSIANEARSLGTIDDNPAQTYIKMKNCEYRYYETLRRYVPIMLKNEDFYKSKFG